VFFTGIERVWQASGKVFRSGAAHEELSVHCFVRLTDAVFACGPISTLHDVMSAVPVRDAPATVT